jgi:predicted component of type VI protein secretion system
LRIRSPVVGRGEVVFEVTSPRVTIGRGEDCDVVLLEQAASRFHAEIRATDSGYTLFDAGSDNGVWIDRQRVTQHLLRDGDTFRIGDSTLQLVLHPHAQTTYVPAIETPALVPSAAPPAAPPPAHPVPAMQLPLPPPPPAFPPTSEPAQPSPPAWSQPVAAHPFAQTVPQPARAAQPPVSHDPPIVHPPAAAMPQPAAPPQAPEPYAFGDASARRPDSQPYVLGNDARGHRPPSFVWTPPQPASSAPTFFGDLADVPDDLRPPEDEPLPRPGPWIALFFVIILVIAGVVAYAFGLRTADLFSG